MRTVTQRVKWARVKVDDVVVGEVERGLLILLGVAAGDGTAEAEALAKKIVGLRIFAAADGKMGLCVNDVAGGCLVVSQFTLLADCGKGRRPYFGAAAPPEPAARLCEHFVSTLRQLGVSSVATGRFGAMMQVELCNDGPVTILLDAP